ncbi:MAG: pyridoxamine 5'-phosphate oxidase family protein, partial [Actinomycetota bacterium]
RREASGSGPVVEWISETTYGRRMEFYTEAQRRQQERFDTTPLADALAAAIVTTELSDEPAEFIAARDFFFLSTVNERGEPPVSYKGGDVGTVTVVDPTTLAFPVYDGNGMFLSVGNITDTAKIGMLFIDFETPNRVRVQADAQVHDDHELLHAYPGAVAVVVASITSTFVNCARYIHSHERIGTSSYVPDDDGAQPVPSWKRIDLLQAFLDESTQADVVRAGGTITSEEYADRLAAGTS